MASRPAPEECKHEYVFNGLCGACGRDVGRAVGSDMVRVMGWGMTQDGLLVSRERAVAQARQVEERLLRARRLALIVDLDQTLIHTTTDGGAAAWVDNGTPDLIAFALPGAPVRYYTKLRPHARAFLAHVAQRYEMHVHTFGTRQYALAVLRALDPDRSLFGDRILTKDESFDARSKSLNLASLFPGGTRMVAIIDDTQPVWEYSRSLVPALPYIFFRHVDEVNAVGAHRDIAREAARFRRACDVRLNVASRVGLPADVLALLARVYGGPVLAAVCDALLAHVQNLCEWPDEDLPTAIARLLARIGIGGGGGGVGGGGGGGEGEGGGAGESGAVSGEQAAKAWAADIAAMLRETDAQWDTQRPAVGSERSVPQDLARAVAFLDVALGSARVSFAVADPHDLLSPSAAAAFSSTATSAASLTMSDAPAPSAPALSAPASSADPAPTTSAPRFKQPNRRAQQPSGPAQPAHFRFVLAPPAAGDGAPLLPAVREFLLDAIDCVQRVTHQPDGTVAGWLGPFLGTVQAGRVSAENTAALSALLKHGKQRAAVLGLRVLAHLAPGVAWRGGDGDGESDGEGGGNEVSVLLRLMPVGGELYMRVARQRAPPDRDAGLQPLQAILDEVHERFYAAPASASVDVVVDAIALQRPDYPPWCLRGVCILFSGVIPLGTPPAAAPLWVAARSHGARCVEVLDDSVTHVVASGLTDKVKRARARLPAVRVVRVEWLHRCLQLRARVPEHDFLVTSVGSSASSVSNTNDGGGGGGGGGVDGGSGGEVLVRRRGKGRGEGMMRDGEYEGEEGKEEEEGEEGEEGEISGSEPAAKRSRAEGLDPSTTPFTADQLAEIGREIEEALEEEDEEEEQELIAGDAEADEEADAGDYGDGYGDGMRGTEVRRRDPDAAEEGEEGDGNGEEEGEGEGEGYQVYDAEEDREDEFHDNPDD